MFNVCKNNYDTLNVHILVESFFTRHDKKSYTQYDSLLFEIKIIISI